MSKNKNHKNQNPAQMTESPSVNVTDEVKDNTSEIKNIDESVETAGVETELPDKVQDNNEEYTPNTGDNSIDPIVEESTSSVVNEEAQSNKEEEITTDAEGYYVAINTNKDYEFVHQRLSKLGFTVRNQSKESPLTVGPFTTYEKARGAKKLIIGIIINLM